MKKLIGVFFIFIGFIILITPFTPGSVILLVGLSMVFGDRWPWIREINTKVEVFLKDLIKRIKKILTKIDTY